MKVYKIMNEKGLFSGGGRAVIFGKKGKVWSGIGGLKNHLRLADCYYDEYDNCKVIEIECDCLASNGTIYNEQSRKELCYVKELLKQIEINDCLKREKKLEQLDRAVFEKLKKKYNW